MYKCFLSYLALCTALLWGNLVYANQLKTLYSSAQKAYSSGQWTVAIRDFRRLLPLMKASELKRRKGSKGSFLMTLGRCDVLFHIADAHWRLKKYKLSCQTHEKILGLVKRLPPTWRSWSVHPDVPRRLASSAQHLSSACATVPSDVTFQLSPKRLQQTAVIEMLIAPNQWNSLPRKGFPTRKQVITLRIKAPGFQTKLLKGLQVPRWGELVVTTSLKPMPKPRPRIIARKPTRLPPRPVPPTAATPFYKTWWFWTIAGVVVASGVVVGVVIATSAEQKLEFQPGQGSSSGFPIW